jgi:hypothetical protein
MRNTCDVHGTDSERLPEETITKPALCTIKQYAVHKQFTLSMALRIVRDAGPTRTPEAKTLEFSHPTEPGTDATKPNPDWVESLMGFPDGWTDGLPVQGSRKSHGKRLERVKAPSTERQD